MKKGILQLVFLFFSAILFGQTNSDSLWSVYQNDSQADSFRLEALLNFTSSIITNYPDSAINICTDALESDTSQNYPKIKIELLNQIGFAWGLKGNNAQQIDYYEKCLLLSEELDYGMGICRYYVNMGMKSSSEDNFDKAIYLFKQSLKASKEYGIHDNDQIILSNLALSYFNNADYENAFKYYSKALRIYEHNKDLQGISNSYQSIGQIFIEKGKYKSALQYQLKNNIVSDQLNDPDRIASSNLDLANTYYLINEYDSSMFHVLKARKYFTLVDNHKMIGLSHLTEGNIWLKIGSPNRAKENCEKASKILGNDIAIQKRIEICDCLSYAYKELGDFKMAIKNMESSYTLSKGRDKIGADKKIQKTEFEKELLADSLEVIAIKHSLEMEHQALLRKSNVKKNIFISLLLLIMVVGGLWSRIRYIRRTNAKLKLAINRAEQSEQFKQQFLANMSHEIRTPMNAVLGMTNLTLDTSLTTKQKRYLSAIKNSSKNLLIIINDILDLSKLEAGKMELENVPFNLENKLKQVISTLRFKAEEKGLQLKLSIGENVPQLLNGDPGRLIQILLNLCGNAIKFTEKGYVEIKVETVNEAQSSLVFSVSDTGIGIPQKQLDVLFNAFAQGDISTSRKFGGTGLGLTISKNLVELQNGEIYAKSAIGKGSEFTFIIPFKIASIEDVKEHQKAYPTDFSVLQGLRVLIAEDNKYNQIVINDTLENLIENVSISIVDNGELAIEYHKNNDYDIILMDVQMPIMDGIEATKFIREQLPKSKKEIPIIALTASVLQSDINKCLNAGMNAFIPKPFRRDELIGTLIKFYSPNKRIVFEEKAEQQKSIAGTENRKKITDLTFLEEFCDSDESRMKKYIDLYIKSTPTNLTKIDTLFNEEDFVSIKNIIHSMKPHFNFMGMVKARKLADAIEILIAENALKELINEELNKLKQYAEKSIIELLKWNY